MRVRIVGMIFRSKGAVQTKRAPRNRLEVPFVLDRVKWLVLEPIGCSPVPANRGFEKEQEIRPEFVAS